MDYIDPQTVVVFNHSDLNTALSIDNNIINVHFGADFALSSGIRIHSNKASLLINGFDPRKTEPVIHTFTDFDSDSNTGCVYYEGNRPIPIVIQNINIIGRNFYGIPCIRDNAGNEGLSVSYYNVTYNGPQVIWHPRGLTRFVDCTITISRGHSPPHDVGEVSKLEIGGKTVIEHLDSALTNPVFHFYNRSGASFTVMKDADVNISTVYDFFITETPVSVVLQENAHFTLSTQRGISRSSSYTFSSFHLYKDSVFNYTRLSNAGSLYTLFMSGQITLEEGSDFMMVADIPAYSGSLLYFMSANAGMNINNANRFALYNSGTYTTSNCFYFSVNTSFNYTCNQVNYWRAASSFPGAGTFTDVAPWRWYKDEWATLEMSGTARVLSTNVTSNNLTPEESAKLPDITDMQLHQAKVYSVGVLPLTVDTIVGDSRPITGTSLPLADIELSYTTDPFSDIKITQCDSTGNFTVLMTEELPPETEVEIASNLRFLITTLTLSAAAAGDLTISSAPELITFIFRPISQAPVILPRAIPDAPVTISDERVDVDRIIWVLWAKIDGPLRAESGETLPDSLVFMQKGETDLTELSEEYTIVHTNEPLPEELFDIIWENTEGVLARITAPIHANVKYSAKVTWLVLPLGTLPDET